MAEPRSTSRSTVDSVLMMDSNSKVVDVKKYDILLSDIVGETISGLEIDGVKHLSSADDISPATLDSLKGLFFGPYDRVLVMARLSKKKKAIHRIRFRHHRFRKISLQQKEGRTYFGAATH